MKVSDVRRVVEWIRLRAKHQNAQWAVQTAWEQCADAVEKHFSPTVKVVPDAKHEFENNACYSFRCGACGGLWSEIWGSMDDLSGYDPEPGMEVECEHCGTELRLACWDPDMEGMYDEGDEDEG